MTDDHDLGERLAVAQRIAREAGELTLKYFQTAGLQVERKGDNTPVTVADRAAEEHLRQQISQAFPRDGILGEELGEAAGSSGYRWIVDPIDGTKSFIHGVPLYTTLVAVEHAGRSVIGVIFAPATDELVSAAAGRGAWYSRGGAPAVAARVSRVPRLAEALFVTSEVANFTRCRVPDALDVYLTLQNATRLCRTWGDAYGYLLVATGRAEVMIDPAIKLWDAAALQPVVEEAGGTFTDWQGEPTIYSGEGIATNGLVLDEVLAVTRPTTGTK